MNLKHKLIPALLLTLASAAPAFATSSLTFQGVTFSTFAVDSDTLSVTISGANGATGDWSGVHYLKAFSLKGLGSIASSSVVSGPSFSSIAESGRELSANGCAGGNSGGACFSFATPVALTSSMTWTIDLVATQGTTLNLTAAPHFKVDFYKNLPDRKSTGSLLSQNLVAVAAVPEPETYALMLAGLGLVGAVARRRKAKARAA